MAPTAALTASPRVEGCSLGDEHSRRMYVPIATLLEVHMTAEGTALTELFKLQHEDVRWMFQLLVSWFTFFLTVLLVAYGWFFTKKPSEHPGRNLRRVGWFFLVQILLAIGACAYCMAYFARATDTSVRIAKAMANAPIALTTSVSREPLSIIQPCVVLMILALVVNFCFWAELMVNKSALERK